MVFWGPMGLASTGDAFCKKSDDALAGMTLCKIVDDIAVQGDTVDSLYENKDAMLLLKRLNYL